MTRWIAIATAACLIGACSQDPTQTTDSELTQPAYAAPPVASAVEVSSQGGLTVRGQAGPDERVRLIQMDGTAHGVTAGGDGAFAIVVPGVTATNLLFNLSVERAGQSVSSDGWLFSPAAAPTRAVMLRAGGASRPVGAAPLLATIDMDPGGGVALAGRAEPGAMVSINIDGQARGRAEAGEDGVWFMVLTSAVPAGPHTLVARAGEEEARAELNLAPSRPEGALETVAVPSGVRIAWGLPGGGSQTTWVLL